MDDPASAIPELAVVVLALGAPPETIRAIRSLLRQQPPVEIVVVNSGGGDMAALLSANQLDLPVVERAERVYVGAARNLGIAATRARYVAFLASDCEASPNWARNRLETHRRGYAAVGSSVVNSHRRNPFAWASHLTLWPWRQPGLKKRGLPFGASYDRQLFETYGTFREDLRVAEDTEFNARLPEDMKPIWQPKVRTVHANPTNPVALVRDHFARGTRAARSTVELHGLRMDCGPKAWWRKSSVSIRMARHTHPRDQVYVRLAKPIIPVATAAYCLGAALWLMRQPAATRALPRTGGSTPTPVTPVAPKAMAAASAIALQAGPEESASAEQTP